MEFYSTLGELPAGFGPSAVTIGKFDGLHLGHQALVARTVALAKERGLVSTAFTFDRNPLDLLRPAESLAPLTSNEQRLELLSLAGLDATLMLQFTQEVAQLEPEAFVSSVLADALRARIVVVGANFTFGHRGSGTVDTLRALGPRYGFEVDGIDQVEVEGEAVSSTRIRSLLASGDVVAAARLLGRPPGVRGLVVHGDHRGRELGYPTANLAQGVEGYLPADGVYAARLTLDGTAYPAAVSIGNNPTFDGVPAQQVEAHVIDEKLDLYGKTVELAFIEYIRPMQKFSGPEALAAQMGADETRIRGILGVPLQGEAG